MTKIKAKQVASYFVNQKECEFPNTFDGNMKLQKLLTFANLIHIFKNDEELFSEDMYAFRNGIVVEDTRVPFNSNYSSYMNELEKLDLPDLNSNQQEAIDASVSIFNKLSARELSDLHHELETWNYKYNKSKHGDFHIKHLSKIKKEDIFETDMNRIKKVIESYERNEQDLFLSETVNGITFYYDPKEFDFSDSDNPKLMSVLENLSKEVQSGEEKTFFLSYDEDQGIYYY